MAKCVAQWDYLTGVKFSDHNPFYQIYIEVWYPGIGKQFVNSLNGII